MLEKRLTGWTLILLLIMAASSTEAADTTETFDPGVSDFEFYMGYDGIGLEKYEGTLYAEALLGIGFMDRFSGYLAVAGESNEIFSNGGGGVSLGIFGTALDTDHVDMDLFLDASFSTDSFGLTPALEINFDLQPDLAVWGLYIRIEENLSGRDETEEPEDAPLSCKEQVSPQGGKSIVCTPLATDDPKASYAFAPSTGLTFGTYYTVSDGHQLLLEFDMSLANNPADDEDTLEVGGLALGYNVVLSDSIEMANQLFFDLPQNGEDFSIGIGTGLIVTLPSVGAAD